MTTPIEPYYRPPPATDPQEEGKCWQYVLCEAHAHVRAGAPDPELRVLRGRTNGHLGHAWIERGGFAYDWQGFRNYGEKEPLPIAEFRTKRGAEARDSFSAEEAPHHITEANWQPQILDQFPTDNDAAREEDRARSEAYDRAEVEHE